MVHGVYLKCEVCGSVIATKVQVGYLSSHPIRINCAKCGILISGHFFSNQKEVKFGLEFKNAIEVYDLE